MTNITPCEIIVWKILPAIRRELAKSLKDEHDFSQKETAEKLGLTEAAVSRYLSRKRGDLEIINDKISKQIRESAKKIIDGNDKTVITEICNICNILKSDGVVEEVSHQCK